MKNKYLITGKIMSWRGKKKSCYGLKQRPCFHCLGLSNIASQTLKLAKILQVACVFLLTVFTVLRMEDAGFL